MEVLRYAAFTTTPEGGNPAGVVLDATGASDVEMQAVAAEVGYSETAFVTEGAGTRAARVRYFSPLVEVDFCGHATIATGVALAERLGVGDFELRTNAGVVPVAVAPTPQGLRAALTSVATWSRPATPEEVEPTLSCLGWSATDLADPAVLPAHVAWSGNEHLVLPVATRARLADMAYDFDRLRAHMLAHRWPTVLLVHVESDELVHARNPFATGGVVEDPATGSAAAAFGGYLHALGRVTGPREVLVHQGDDMGRPSRLTVQLRPGDLRVTVAGTAVPIPA
ncbi:PhzF family phenazine biosynthesis protein [Motilibacter peucedani]|uniref:PhzF family phenazine biosynthesis protein n=1 Tax=Motilibacter peucedani TaxID=598650 RepID=A0A420XT60_9ACTN|nr:PhzF family phenazine biosynthesis isomerase [Motilibacter peucedani]RKS80032.1 PhzF family phenazine biosynthesis protein [Motilibacter peucedani]